MWLGHSSAETAKALSPHPISVRGIHIAYARTLPPRAVRCSCDHHREFRVPLESSAGSRGRRIRAKRRRRAQRSQRSGSKRRRRSLCLELSQCALLQADARRRPHRPRVRGDTSPVTGGRKFGTVAALLHQFTRSITMAVPMPAPMQSVISARSLSARSSSSTIVPRIMAPVAPIG
jgi:hypothetical protein